MSEVYSESDSTPDISQSSTDDSGINTYNSTLGGSEEAEGNPTPSCSDVLAELFQSQKKLKEAETQVRSLSLILEHDQAGTEESSPGINLAVFQQNKHFLEEEIMKIKKDIYDKESFLQQSDLKLFKQYSDSLKDDTNKNEGRKMEENYDIMHLNEETSLPNDMELTTSDFTLEEKNHCCFSDKDEITKLRRALSETKQKHKKERDEILRQLKALQVTTVNGETNWRCVVREKQLKIDELTKKNAELQDKHEILNACEKLKQKEAKENEKKKKKDEKVITSLRKQNMSINKEIKLLQNEVKELTDIDQESKATMKQLTERNKELKLICDKNQTSNDENKILHEYSNEIRETNTLVNKLIMEINIVSTEKDDLSQRLELATNTLREEKLRFESLVKESDNKNKSFVDVGIQTEESQLKDELRRMNTELKLEKEKNTNLLGQLHEQRVSVERLRKKEVELEKEWRNKSIENERTIQELTISLGMATAANELSCQRKFEECRNIETKELEVFEEIKMELSSVKKDLRKHEENVESLRKNWRKYKSSVLQIYEELNSQKRNPDATF